LIITVFFVVNDLELYIKLLSIDEIKELIQDDYDFFIPLTVKQNEVYKLNDKVIVNQKISHERNSIFVLDDEGFLNKVNTCPQNYLLVTRDEEDGNNIKDYFEQSR
jgi:hypothetical protein